MEIPLKFMKQNEYKTVENYPEKARISPHSPTLGFHENYLLADYFTLIAETVYTDPLPSIKIGGEGGLYTGYQSSASKGYCVTDVTGK